MSDIEIFKRSGNRALEVNPPPAYINIHITNHGSNWLWAAFAVFAVLTIVHAGIYGFTSSKNKTLKKALFVGPFITNFVMAIAYFTYASNLGYTGIATEFHHIRLFDPVRQIFYVKYIGWFLAWPFVLYEFEVATHTLDLSAHAEAGKTLSGFIHLFSSLFTKIFATEVFVLGLLIGALIQSSYKWGYFVFAVFGQLFAITLILTSLKQSLRLTNSNRRGLFFIGFQVVVWILYPIAWGLSEGGNYIKPDSEAVFYGILDLITFAFIPTIMTFYNASGLNEDAFLHFNLPRFRNEKHVVDSTPRASGDTAVPVAAVPVPSIPVTSVPVTSDPVTSDPVTSDPVTNANLHTNAATRDTTEFV